MTLPIRVHGWILSQVMKKSNQRVVVVTQDGFHVSPSYLRSGGQVQEVPQVRARIGPPRDGQVQQTRLVWMQGSILLLDMTA